MKTLYTLMIVFLSSCSSSPNEMDGIESQISSKLEAEKVELYHQASNSTVNGVPSGSNSYLVLDIYNSNVLSPIKNNKSLLNTKCNEIKDIILNLPTLSFYPKFNEIRIVIIDTNGFLIFKTKTTTTVTYDIR